MTAAVSSAAGLISLLDEDDDKLKVHALTSLNKLVDQLWYQISGSVALLEAIYEDNDFSNRELAALVTSKVFYHLGELDDALHYALRSGTLFDIASDAEYTQTMIARCLDKYYEQRQAQDTSGESAELDASLEDVVRKLFDRCCAENQFEQAVGVALESMRTDWLETTLQKCPDQVSLLKYTLQVVQKLVIKRQFRQQVLRLIVQMYEGAAQPDWLTICQCLMFLDAADEVAKVLHRLLQGSQEDVLLAYQIGFDLVENEMQSFMIKVRGSLDQLLDTNPQQAAANATDAAASNGNDVDGSSQNAPEHYQRLKEIISGTTTISLNLQFLYWHNKTDLQILKNIKGAFDSRNSVCHSATVLANALMHCGTTLDTFLRENLEWLARATNWAKFSATAGLGVIHRGHLTQSRALMAPHLPHDGAHVSPFQEGGALFAMGLIHANHGEEIQQFLVDSLRNSSNEIVQHGACLGVGLASLGTNNDDIFEEMKGVLYTDSAVAGEAAGIGMGLLAAGTGTDKTAELLAYAHDTQHEKIIRGLAVGLALIMYGREEGADGLIEQMTRDQDPILRYGGMYCIGMAYRGTDNNAAVQKLLHFAVTDVSNDVRRAAVLCLGFVLMNVPQQCPKIVSLLAESFNPHMRYGAAMAVGIACAGTGLKEAVALLEPMLHDTVDYVRQGAVIAMAMVMIEQPEKQLGIFRKHLQRCIGDKHEEVMSKMGAIMASGIIDAGGRNMTIGLRSSSGYFRRTAVLGIAVFTQYWFWYPFSYFFSLALTPTAFIALNQELRLPVFSLVSNCRKSLFAYAIPVTQQSSTQVSKVPTAVLSTTAKARERARKKAEDKQGKDGAATSAEAITDTGEPDAAMETDQGQADGAGEKTKEADECPYNLSNPSRITPAQQKYIQMPAESRWQPLAQKQRLGLTGVIMLQDTRPGEEIEYVPGLQARTASLAGDPSGSGATAAAAGPVPTAVPMDAQQDDEPEPPEPFEYVPPS